MMEMAAFDYRFNLEYGKEYFEDDGNLKLLRSIIDEKTNQQLIDEGGSIK